MSCEYGYSIHISMHPLAFYFAKPVTDFTVAFPSPVWGKGYTSQYTLAVLKEVAAASRNLFIPVHSRQTLLVVCSQGEILWECVWISVSTLLTVCLLLTQSFYAALLQNDFSPSLMLNTVLSICLISPWDQAFVRSFQSLQNYYRNNTISDSCRQSQGIPVVQ